MNSFDEERLDPHGECAHEIARLRQQVEGLERERDAIRTERNESAIKWRETFDAMHQRAMRAEEILRRYPAGFAEHVDRLAVQPAAVEQDEEMLDRVSQRLGCYPQAWDCIDPIRILRAVIEETTAAPPAQARPEIAGRACRESDREMIATPAGQELIQKAAQHLLNEARPVAWFDNNDELIGRVSDEQLDVLCTNALLQLRRRHGWPSDDSPSEARPVVPEGLLKLLRDARWRVANLVHGPAEGFNLDVIKRLDAMCELLTAAPAAQEQEKPE